MEKSLLGHLRDMDTSQALLRQLQEVVGHVTSNSEENALAQHITAGLWSRHFPQALQVEMSECEAATLELAVLDTHGSLADIPSSSDEVPVLPAGTQSGSLDDCRAWKQRHQQVVNDAAIFMLAKVEEAEPQSRRSFVPSLQRMMIMEMKEAARLLLLFGGMLENVPEACEGPDDLSRDAEIQLGTTVEDVFSKLQALGEVAWVGQDVDEGPRGGLVLKAHQDGGPFGHPQ